MTDDRTDKKKEEQKKESPEKPDLTPRTDGASKRIAAFLTASIETEEEEETPGKGP